MAFYSRTIAAPPEQVFAAFQDVARLARWWGPAGFSNTFAAFAFEPGGQWSFTMHGPDGRDYTNEMVVREIEAPGRIVVDHVTAPAYGLTVTLEAAGNGSTLVGWDQQFANPAVEAGMEAFLATANEQVF